MSSPFHIDKLRATQAAGVLLRCAPNRRMSRLRLLKLLYIAEREALKEKGRPITGDRISAMQHGPVLSDIYDMIKDTHADPAPWPDFIASHHNDVVLEGSPGTGDLSRWEVNKLQEIWTRYENRSDWDIVDNVVHKLPEHIEYGPKSNTSRPIPHKALLLLLGLSEEDAEQILEDAREEVRLDQLWDRVAT